MNILHLEASTGWGGQEIRIFREAEGMQQRGHRVVIAVAKGGELASRARNAGISVYELHFRKRFWFFTFFQLLRIVKKEAIDLINTHSSLDSWIGGIVGKILRKKVIRTRHLSSAIRAGWNSRILYGKLADFVVTTCAAVLPPIIRQSGRSQETSRSIPTGVHPSQIQVDPEEVASFRKQFHADFLVGTACVMRSWKGIDDLLEAAHLLRDVPGIQWVIIGGGHSERHKRKAKELNVEHLVCFTGHLERPFPAIAALDVFTLLSTAHEGVSQAILQAAYLSRPLISTQVGGLGEVCIDQKTGLNVEPFAAHQVARAVLALKKDPALRSRFGKEAKKLVEESFTLKHTLDQMEEVYLQSLRSFKNG